MRSAFIWVEATYDATKFKPPEEIGLILPQNAFAVFTYIINIRDS